MSETSCRQFVWSFNLDRDLLLGENQLKWQHDVQYTYSNHQVHL